MPSSTARSDAILDRLKALHPKSIDLSLGRVERLLAALDHPERRLPPVVHVAGTNGKGSTLALLAAMLRAGGDVRVDRYISPHLVRFNERILLGGEPIPEPRLTTTLDACERANAGHPITFFEITTAAAFLAFAQAPRADWLLLETGLGGRLDATSVVERTRLVLLTTVSMDHESYLGNTLPAIAAEKAGILKAGVPAVVGRQEPEALAVIERRAAVVGSPLLVHGRDWDAREEAGRLVVEIRRDDGRRLLNLPLPTLPGVHQVDNAGLAVAAALCLPEAGLTEAEIAAGLASARWPARLQRLTRGPAALALPPGCELWLDGGHNPAAGEALARTFAAQADPRPLHLVVGMLATKDLGAFLRPLARLAASLTAVPIPGEAAARDPAEVATAAREVGLAAVVAGSVEAAVREITRRETRPFRVLVCGSLHLAGELLRAHG
jgi:dihydrofolate synthase/folylpolyglutamate synthase